MNSAADFDARVDAVVERFDPEVRDMVRRDLQPLFDVGVRTEEDLFAIVEDTGADPGRRERAFWLLARLGTAGTAPALIRALEDTDAGLRAGAARLIGESHFLEAVDLLAARLRRDPEPAVRHAAAYALGQLGTAAAAEPLVAALHDTSPMVRGMAAEALAYLRDVSVMPSLLLALHDTSAEVRYWGAFAVGELGGEEAIPALRRLADSDEESAEGYGAVRNAAEEAILSILERVNQNGDRDTE